MAEYIEKEKLIAWFMPYVHIGEVVPGDLIVADISAMKSADVAFVTHGKWAKPVPGDGENYCSICKKPQPWFYGYGYYLPDYCPHCGAKMDLK